MSNLQLGSESVFERRQETGSGVQLSVAAFYSAVVASTLAGYVVMAAVALSSNGWIPESTFGVVMLFVGVIASMIIGSIIAIKSANWLISLVAYTVMIAGAFGLLISPVVPMYGTDVVVLGIGITIVLNVVAALIGLATKTDLEQAGFGGVITGVLFVFLIASVVVIYFFQNPTAYAILALIGVAVFFGMMVYNFNRSKFVEKNLDNAVDIGMQNYLDSLNMLLRIWQLLAQARRS